MKGKGYGKGYRDMGYGSGCEGSGSQKVKAPSRLAGTGAEPRRRIRPKSGPHK